MPELPEVETSCRGISPHCTGVKIEKIVVRQPKLRWPVDQKLSSKLQGKTIVSVTRRAKYILLHMEVGVLMIHLGMSGSIRVLMGPVEAGKHDHIDIELSNGKILRYNDPRRFGSFVLNTQADLHPLIIKLGVEPLTEAFDVEYLYMQCKTRQTPIKALIMNNHIVVGVGNIYAQEALFSARISPLRAANKISKKRLDKLVIAIKEILNAAINAGGSSLKDFTSAEGKPGYFQHTHQVYGKKDQACPVCTKPLKQIVIAQRSTVYCVSCQK